MTDKGTINDLKNGGARATGTGKRAVLALSGGMDSTTLLWYARKQGYDIHALGFYYRQNHKKELDMARWHCRKLGVPFETVDLGFLGRFAKGVSSLTSGAGTIPDGLYDESNMKSTVVPFRNGLFLSILAARADSLNADVILYGAHTGDHAVYKDCRPEFVGAMATAITLGSENDIVLTAPFVDMTKSAICKTGLELGVPYEKTWSCYRGGKRPCGKCGTCTERVEAFYENGTEDPLMTPAEWDAALGNYLDLKKKKDVRE